MSTLVNNQSKHEKESVIKLLDSFLDRYGTTILYYDNDCLKRIRGRLSRARKEFDSTRFFVLVVGPLKSGKSSFVNILTRAHVSPTDVLECTAIPTIIGKSDREHLKKIVSYFPKNIHSLPEEEKIKLREKIFDHIIDVLRGIESSSVIEQLVDTETRDATDDTIKEVVMVDAESTKKYPMLATIGVEGGGFIDDQIMLIDMPGLDGKSANDRNPLYQRMVERADFIFFVQSSTSAINEATNDFLDWLLSNRLTEVPLRLIHNVHDSLYFVKDDITEKTIARQVNAGVKCIREKFNVGRNFENYILNFAKIGTGLMSSDKIKDDFQEGMTRDIDRYLDVERQIVEKLKAERQSIKDNNCIAKSRECITQSIAELDALSADLDKRIQLADEAIRKTAEFKSRIISQEISFAQLMEFVNSAILTNNIEGMLKSRIELKTGTALNRSGDIKGEALMQEIDKLAELYGSDSPVGENTDFRMLLVEHIHNLFGKTYAEIRNEMTAFFQEELRKEVRFDDSLSMQLLPAKLMAFTPDYFDIRKNLNLFGLTNKLCSKKYSAAERRDYLNLYKELCKQQVSDKITEYKLLVRAALNEIKSKWIESLSGQRSSYADEVGRLRSEEKRQLTAQRESIKEMQHELNR